MDTISKRETIIICNSFIFICLLFLYGCGGSGDGNTGAIEDSSDDFYVPISETDANVKYEELGFITDMKTVHIDGTGNSTKGITDINRILIDRGDNGDLYIAYDALIYSLGFEYLDPDSWTGSNRFFLLIDNDNDITTGEQIGGIGADIKLSSIAQYIWSDVNNSWSSTWFETAPPYMDLRFTPFGSYEVHTKLNGIDSYIRVFQGIKYLDALTLGENSKAILTIPYNIVDESSQMIIAVTLDSSSSFDIPSLWQPN